MATSLHRRALLPTGSQHSRHTAMSTMNAEWSRRHFNLEPASVQGYRAPHSLGTRLSSGGEEQKKPDPFKLLHVHTHKRDRSRWMKTYGQKSSRDYQWKAFADSDAFANGGTGSSHRHSSSNFTSPSISRPRLPTSNPISTSPANVVSSIALKRATNNNCISQFAPRRMAKETLSMHGLLPESLGFSLFDWIFLWNPSIHKYVALPCLKLDSHSYFPNKSLART